MAYPLGWSVIECVALRRERWSGRYDVACTPLVSSGQEVLPDQPILRIEQQEQAEAVQSLPRLVLPSIDTQTDLRTIKPVGAIASTNKEQGMTLPSGLYGRVVAITPRRGVVIECSASVVQGALGVGGPVVGVLTMWQGNAPGRASQVIPPGAILVVPGPLNLSLLRQALNSGVAGVVASSIEMRDFEGFLRADLIQLLRSNAIEQAPSYLPVLTLCLTEGLGTHAMPVRVLNLLSRYQGSIVFLSGATSLQRGLYPELIISLPPQSDEKRPTPTRIDLTLSLAAHVRVCGGEHEGVHGIIEQFFHHQMVFASGIRAQAVRIRTEEGALLVVPLANIERVG